MKRVKYTIANWKMNGLNGAVKVVNSIDRHIKKTRHKKSNVVICPPFTLLTNFINAKTGINFGGQDCHHLNEGAFTGCISAQMLKSAGCKYVIIGHSERREYQKETSKELNLKIKFRESFRPFAPSVLSEDVKEWFELNYDSPYMLLVSDVKKEKQITMSEKDNKLFGIDKLNIKRSSIPAITHVDYSARIQTVHKETNPKYYDLINEFKKITNCPVLVNTSFNVRGEPIVCSVEDAFNCFMGTNLDVLVIENFILFKDDQDKSLLKDYKNKFELD